MPHLNQVGMYPHHGNKNNNRNSGYGGNLSGQSWITNDRSANSNSNGDSFWPFSYTSESHNDIGDGNSHNRSNKNGQNKHGLNHSLRNGYNDPNNGDKNNQNDNQNTYSSNSKNIDSGSVSNHKKDEEKAERKMKQKMNQKLKRKEKTRFGYWKG